MNRILADFIAMKNNSTKSNINNANYSSISDINAGYPCIRLSYEEWLQVKQPSPDVLWMVEDYPSAEELSNGVTSSIGLVSPSGKVFKGRKECMKKESNEPLIEVLLRYGWDSTTQIYSGLYNNDVVDKPGKPNNPDKPDNPNPPDDTEYQLVYYFNNSDYFPEEGKRNSFYFDRRNTKLYSYDADNNKYVPLAELFSAVIIDGQDKNVLDDTLFEESVEEVKPVSRMRTSRTLSTRETITKDLIEYYNDSSEFPVPGYKNCFCYDILNTTLYNWNEESQSYVALGELIANIVIDNNN